MNQKPTSGGVAVHPKSTDADPLDPKQFDPDWARNQPAPPSPAARPAAAPTIPLKRTTPQGNPTLGRTTPGGTPTLGRTTPPHGNPVDVPKAGSIPGFGAAQKPKPVAHPKGPHAYAKPEAMQYAKPPVMQHGHGRATPADGISQLELQEEQPNKEEAPVENIIAPELPAGVEMPHLEVTPQAVDKDNKPREKVDFENLPEFIAQRKMLRNAKIGAILGTLVLLACVIYFGFFAGKKAVKPIVNELVDELKKEKTTDELIKQAEDKKEDKK